MALKPKARPAPRAIASAAVFPALFSETRKASILPRSSSSSHHFSHRLADPAQDLDGVTEIEQDRFLDAGQIFRDHLRQAALGEERANALEIAGGVGEAQPAPPERGKLGPRLLGRAPSGLPSF